MNTLKHESVNIHEDIGVKLYLSIDNGSFTVKHWHYSLEVILILNGSFNLFIDNERLNLKENDLIILNPKQIHSAICSDGNESIVLQIPYKFLEENIPNINELRINYKELLTDTDNTNVNKLKNTLNELYKIYSKEPKLYILNSKILLYEFLYILYVNYSISIDSISYKNTDKYFDRLKIITDYVKENYKEQIYLSTASKVVNLTPQYLSRFFKTHMGITFTSYVNNIRLENMYSDLINTDNNILDIIQNNGFYNYKQFMKLFKKIYNCTPSQKRQQINKTRKDVVSKYR
ncbi:TPA: helix-turn-helix transcriptional regulator [Clostridioides difficile]|nr:helix-turn-helix transcriptional regulator [Clostridioides difficile]HBG1250521.1 helix-turn-helix transcriptional regulator [Clostridioides difficile]HBG4142103.1 helix-turn-helix transcriptional regulator [Clostridioides difficile]